MRKVVGTVTETEKTEVQSLFNRKRGLEELIAALPRNSNVYETALKDYLDTTQKFHAWWDTMSVKYAWESVEGANWQIDFENCDIFIQ